jgi:phosphatidylserine synthase 2
MLSHHTLEKDEYSHLFHYPRTITFIVALIVGANYLSDVHLEKLREQGRQYFKDDSNPDVFEDYRWPILFAFCAVAAFGVTQFPDTHVRRPHPVFWRALLGVFLSYAAFMTFILLLPRDQARKAFKLFHPSFGNPLPERNYAEDCRVFTPEHPVSSMNNIYEAVFDVHFVAHLAGWWFKMMVIRDTKMAWIASASFELIEISLRHWLPNFHECWWDHVSSMSFSKTTSSLCIFCIAST